MASIAPNRQPVPSPKSRAALRLSVTDVEKYLRRFFVHKIAEARQLGPYYEDLMLQIERLVARGGKRMRPRLVIESYRAYGGKDSDAITKVAASQELFHAFILMHDDIIDRDIVRWGGPNISGRYLKEFEGQLKPEDARHYADSWALMAGDVCCNLSFEILAESGFAPSLALKATKLAQQTLFTMVGGEAMDVATSVYTFPDEALGDDHFERLYAAKTSSYSFSTPLRMGAMLAGAGAVQDRRLDKFGYHLGIAFQIRDDILGVFGDEDKTGKSVLSDIREGKRTLMMSHALAAANNAQRAKLKAVLGNPKATKQDLASIQSIIRSTGALDKADNAMKQHCQQAHNILLSGGMPIELSSYLADVVSYCAKRVR